MNEHLRDRVLRKLDTLSDERAYQVLDYIEFLESKYAERQPSATSIFTRFSEAIEDRLRAGKVSASAIAETMGLMNRAMNVLNGVATGVAAAGRSVAGDFERATTPRPPGAGATPATGTRASTASSGGPAVGGPPSGAPVAGSGTGAGAPAGAPPAQSVPPIPSADPSATESGELEPPVEQRAATDDRGDA